MKKLIILSLLFFVVAAGLCEEVTATTTPQSITPDSTYGTMWKVSVINLSDETVYVRRNIRTNEFNAATCIPVTKDIPYNSPTPGAGKIPSSTVGNIVVATTNGTANVIIAFDK